MNVTLAFLAVVAAIAVWWLAQQRLFAKPWLEEGLITDLTTTRASPWPAAKLGLWVLLAVIGSLFALFTSAYLMRMALADWRPLPEPALLWVNTGVLAVSSLALQGALTAARRDRIEGVRTGLFVGGLAACLFLLGQLVAWRQLADAGYFLATNPANTFFYLFTALHGLHLLGGLAALGRTVLRLQHGAGAKDLALGVELCALYWHFLLLVWLGLFGLLLHS